LKGEDNGQFHLAGEQRKHGAVASAQRDRGEVRDAAARAIARNRSGNSRQPIYTGVGPFPRLVEDAAWVRACAKLIKEEGAEQFLVNLLYVLRESLPEESTRP
jgi:hypothetical protein